MLARNRTLRSDLTLAVFVAAAKAYIDATADSAERRLDGDGYKNQDCDGSPMHGIHYIDHSGVGFQ